MCEDQTFVPRYQPKKINVFVSSTFKDMKAERDELTLRVFPALRKVCEDRGISWGEVDLRWGIPEERKGEVLRTCLRFIDDCRPFFIGMLGERYGWVEEDISEIPHPEYPWLQDHRGTSITELEILHGVLNNPAMAHHAFFYFRDPSYIDTLPEDQRPEYLEHSTNEEITKYGEFEALVRAGKRRDRLHSLKRRVKESGLPFRENYKDPIEFGKFVQQDLMRVIDSIAPATESAPLTDAERANAVLDREEMVHEAFAASRFGVYIPRQEYFGHLDAHAEGNSPPLVILGESGSGKSALLAHWVFRYRSQHPNDLVLIHFVGATSESTDWMSMLRRLIGEVKRKFSITAEIPVSDGDLITAFANWLNMASVRGRVVLVIDALNQLEDMNGAPDLIWLPPRIPDTIRLIVSTLPGRSLEAARKRKWSEMTVEPLTIPERKALITCYLKRYHKELAKGLKEELASAPQCQNPLYLRALLEEVRVHGTFEKIPDLIREYIEAKTVDGLYEKILKRYENDYERDRPGLVKDTVSLIWAARRGLSKPELMDLLGTNGSPLPDAYWAPLYLAMEHSLIEKNGIITFFHDYFRAAVKHRYLGLEEQEREVHLKIAHYFALQSDGLRKTEELPWQLAAADDWDRLVQLLSGNFFLNAWEHHKFDIKRYWKQIETQSNYKMTESFQIILQNPEKINLLFIRDLFFLFYETGNFEEASSLAEYLVSSSNDHMEHYDYQSYLGDLALVRRKCGDFKGALKLLKEKEEICRKQHNPIGLAISLGNQASTLYFLGDPESALVLLKEQEKISRLLGNSEGVGTSLGNQALIMKSWGKFDEAMALHKKEEQIFRQLGDIDKIAVSLSNQATLHYIRHEKNDAMLILQEQEQISRQIGNLHILQNILNNQANILRSEGELQSAMKRLQEAEMICRQIKNLEGLARIFGNQAFILMDLGCLDESLSLHKEEESLYRRVGNKNGIQESLFAQAVILSLRNEKERAIDLFKEQGNICRELGKSADLKESISKHALILMEKGDLDGAMALLKEQELICRNHGYKDSLQRSLHNQAIILHTRGNLEGTMAILKEQEQISREINNFEGLQRSLGFQGVILKDRGDLNQATILFKEQELICRKLGTRDFLQTCLCNQAGIQKARGDLNGAMSFLKEQELICRELKKNKDLTRSLWNQASILWDQKRSREAVSAIEEAYKIASDHGYTDLTTQIRPVLENLRKMKK